MHVTPIQTKEREKKLPKPAREVLKRMRQEDADKEAHSNTKWERHQQLQEDRRECIGNIQRLQKFADEGKLSISKPISSGRYAPGVDISQGTQLIADARAELDEIDEQIAAVQSNVWSSTFPYSYREAQRWLANLKGDVTWVECVPMIKLSKGQSPFDALANNRADIEAQEAEIKKAERSWLPLADAENSVIAEIDRIAATGEPDFRSAFHVKKPLAGRPRPGKMAWAKNYIDDDFQPDGFGLTVWLHRDALVERARKELAKLARPEASLSMDERNMKIAEGKKRILELERRDECLVRLCEADPKYPRVIRRKGDFRALLQIADASEEFG